MLKWIFKWLFRLLFIIILIRIFLPESPIYQDYIGQFTEPIFEQLLDSFNQTQLTQTTNEEDVKLESPLEEEKAEEIIKEMNESDYQEVKEEKIKIEETPQKTNECANKIPSANYQRAWKSLDNQKRFRTSVAVSSQTVCESNENRQNMAVNFTDEQTYWQTLYGNLVKYDSPKLIEVFNHFEQIRHSQGLDYAEFAEMVITFIQNVPYTLVLTKTATEAINEGGFPGKYVANKQGPYIENIKFGLQTPIEFLYNLKGDCDTRTVLAYTILSHFGYDVAIINNSTHSMIGINLPAQGTFLPVNGKKYFLWETTNPNWQLGNISPDMQQDKKWFVALASANDM